LRFEGWILETILLSTISTLQNGNWPKNKFFWKRQKWATSAGAATGRFRKRVCELDGLENANLNRTLIACSPRIKKKKDFKKIEQSSSNVLGYGGFGRKAAEPKENASLHELN